MTSSHPVPLAEAINALKSCTWIDLTHEVSESSPIFSAFAPPSRKTLFTVAKDGFWAEEITLTTPTGTHIDAPGHFIENAQLLNDIEIKSLLLPLHVIHRERQVEHNADFTLSMDDIQQYEDEYGQIQPGSFVAFASGWSQHWETPAHFYNKDSLGHPHTPGWSLEALKFLIKERKITAIGHETLDTDASHDAIEKGFLYAEHYVLEENLWQVEVLNNLHQVPATGAFIHISFPNLKQLPSFPVRAIAYLP